MPKGRYAIGIDLGTTNCSLAYVDLQSEQPEVQVLAIPQWEGEDLLGRSPQLPSFVWFLPKTLQKQQSRLLPWHAPASKISHVLGREARLQALRDPDRVAFAAKSWLSVGAPSTRQANILPWGSSALFGDERLSPVKVQSLLLQHLAESWNALYGAGDDPQPFHLQRIVITVPASFDDLAQRLTLEAAAQAHYPAAIELLEEPQAAFYDWYARQGTGNRLEARLILVCDMGGGTSDFTLLRVGTTGSIERLRVSDHLLLGGDSIDLALAEQLRLRMQLGQTSELPRSAWQQLLAQARQLKEDILQQGAEADPEELFHVSVALQEQSLFGAYASASMSRRELQTLILEGFFPQVPAAARPQRPESGLRQFGLPFVQDSAVTRHLAAFLKGTVVDALLCAGGSLRPLFLQQHLQAVLQSWQEERPLELLPQAEPDLAIARGAAWYATQRAEGSELVQSHFPRSLYLEVQTEDGQAQYLCLVPRGQPRTQLSRLEPRGLHLRTGQAVAFQLYSSLLDPVRSDRPLPDWQALPTLTLELPRGGKSSGGLVGVALEAQIRETGTLELACRSIDDASQSWRLDFAVESVPQASAQASLREEAVAPARREAAEQLIRQAFAKNTEAGGLRVEQLPKLLEDTLGLHREEWSLGLLRQLWEPLGEALHRHQRSAAQESSWLYLSGFCLRPGWGAARDPERVRLLWSLFDHGWNKAFAGDKRLESQWWLMWRRIAGGLSSQQQTKLLDRILPALRKEPLSSPEMIRLAAALERAALEKKVQLGRLLVQQISSGIKDQLEARLWALGRISSRYPLAAGPEAIVPPHLIEEWADALQVLPWPSKTYQRLDLFYQWAGRRRGDPLLDIEPHYREMFATRLRLAGADTVTIDALFTVQERSAALDQQLFGESLPSGLLLRSL